MFSLVDDFKVILLKHIICTIIIDLDLAQRLFHSWDIKISNCYRNSDRTPVESLWLDWKPVRLRRVPTVELIRNRSPIEIKDRYGQLLPGMIPPVTSLVFFIVSDRLIYSDRIFIDVSSWIRQYQMA